MKFAKDGKKAVDFSATVKSLGLLIGLDTILEGRIHIMHTPERKAELEEALKGILEAGELTCKHSEQLRGRMIWFEGFVWGRQANSAIRAFRSFIARHAVLAAARPIALRSPFLSSKTVTLVAPNGSPRRASAGLALQ